MKKMCIHIILLLCWNTAVFADNSYMDMSLEELMDVTLTSMSKRVQSLQNTAAAVTVLSCEDIRRSGATTIPDALRMVPGLMIAQGAAGEWAISSRGRSYNPTFDNKLLILIDGRSVYSPLYGGVFWESLDIVMEDIERIEVIRGPGSSIWGANAIQGVINIITKSSQDSQGLMVSALYGTKENGTGTVRYGGKLSDRNTYRVYGKYRNQEGFETLNGDELHDGVESGQAGFRMDLQPDTTSTLMVQGDIYSGLTSGNVLYPELAPLPSMVQRHNDSEVMNADILGRYEHNLGDDSSYSFQTYYSHESRDADAWSVNFDTIDLDFQYQFSPLKNHIAQWGLGYRLVMGDFDTYDMGVSLSDNSYEDNLFSAFVQDEITLGDWTLTLGSKFQHNDQTGFEYLPGGRLLWHAQPGHTLWAAVSRAVRTPSIIEQHGILHNALASIYGNPAQISLYGSKDVEAETAMVYEMGYRYAPSKTFSLDTSVFLTKTDNMVAASLNRASTTPLLLGYIIPMEFVVDNEIAGTIYGVEVDATWKPFRWWKLQGWYSYCEDKYDYNGNSEDYFASFYGHISPHHQFFIRSSFDMPYNTEFDVMGRYTSELPGLDVSDYVSMDARIAWRPQEHVELSLVGRNLLESRHQESSTSLVYGDSGALERSVFMKLQLDF